MGHGIAKNLVAKGFPLTVRVHRNRKPAEDILAAGAREVKTNAEVARASDIVILCVTGSPQVEEIVYGAEGILGAARDGLIVVDTSTAEPSSTAKIRDDLAAKGTQLRRRAAGAHAEGSRRRPAEHDGRRRRRDVRAIEAGAVRVLRERRSRRAARDTATC